MSALPDLDNIIRHTRRYEFEDGLRDLQMALVFALGGFAFWLTLAPPWIGFIAKAMLRFGRWAAWLGLLPVLLAPLAALGSLRLMARLRQAWLWRERGMVQSARWQVPRRVSLIAVAIVAGGIFAGVGLRAFGWIDDAAVLRVLWAATGWGFGCTLVGVGLDIGLTRYVWLGAVGGLTSTALLFLPLEFGGAALALGLLWAILLGASGIAGLWRAAQLPQARH